MLVKIGATTRDEVIDLLRNADRDPNHVESLTLARKRHPESVLIRIDGHKVWTHNSYDAVLLAKISLAQPKFLLSKNLSSHQWNFITTTYFMRGLWPSQIDNYLVIDMAGHFPRDNWCFSLPEMLIYHEEGFRVNVEEEHRVGRLIVEFIRENHGFHVLSPSKSKLVLHSRRDKHNLTEAANDLVEAFYSAHTLMQRSRERCEKHDLRRNKVEWMKNDFNQTPLYNFLRVWSEMRSETVNGGPLEPFVED